MFCSGDIASESGIYRVCHKEHRLSLEVTVLSGNRFPACSKCRQNVSFELIRRVSVDQSGTAFRVMLHTLPQVEDEAGDRHPQAG